MIYFIKNIMIYCYISSKRQLMIELKDKIRAAQDFEKD